MARIEGIRYLHSIWMCESFVVPILYLVIFSICESRELRFRSQIERRSAVPLTLFVYGVLLFLLTPYPYHDERKAKEKIRENRSGNSPNVWFVLSSSRYSSDEMKKILLVDRWNIVIVGNVSCMESVQTSNIHCLSLERQQQLGFRVAWRIPETSYARKNVGYLYAIKMGAEWIYDIDDGVWPFAHSSLNFDFTSFISGFRYAASKDPLLRLLPRQEGGEGRYNEYASPVTISEGVYAPWNSLNTLYHRRAFFLLLLPSSTELNADVVRSYYAQKLLHLIGETVTLHPPRVHRSQSFVDSARHSAFGRNHGGGRLENLLEYLEPWKCVRCNILDCMKDLAKYFRYTFPTKDLRCLRSKRSSVFSGCRRAYVNFAASPLLQNEGHSLSKSKLDDFSDLNAWCCRAYPQGNAQLETISAQKLTTIQLNLSGLLQKEDTVLIIVNNHPWKTAIGLLQRIYQSYFALTIFCGTFNMSAYDETGYPPTQTPFSFIELSEEELQEGIRLYYCLSKVRELRLRNVKGYLLTADDTVLHFWRDIDLNITFHPLGVINAGEPDWYRTPSGEPALLRALKLFREKSVNSSAVRELWKNYEQRISKFNNGTNATQYLIENTGFSNSDQFYIPSTELDYFSDLMEIFFEAGVFEGIAVDRFLASVPHKIFAEDALQFLWGEDDRKRWAELYRPHLLLLHPVKPSMLLDHRTRETYCSTILRHFKEVLLEGKLR